MTATEIVQKIKGYSDGVGMALPIRDESMTVIGWHRAFSRALLADDRLICTMAECHTLCQEYFLTQFEVTPENKRSWLENAVLPNASKLLLLVETLNRRVIGQVGFTLSDNASIFSLDATMRWARGGHPDIILQSAVERCALCFGLFGCAEGRAEMFADNAFAVDQIRSIGFEVLQEHGLRLERENGKLVYAKESDLSRVNTERRLVELSIRREQFAERHRAASGDPCWAGLL